VILKQDVRGCDKHSIDHEWMMMEGVQKIKSGAGEKFDHRHYVRPPRSRISMSKPTTVFREFKRAKPSRLSATRGTVTRSMVCPMCGGGRVTLSRNYNIQVPKSS